MEAEGGEGPSAALCDSLAEAGEFAVAVTAAHSELVCEIYGHEGKAQPPLKTVYNPAVREEYVGMGHVRRQWLIGACLLSVGTTLALIDLTHHMRFIWGYVLGLKCLVLGGTFTVRGFIERHEYRKASQAAG